MNETVGCTRFDCEYCQPILDSFRGGACKLWLINIDEEGCKMYSKKKRKMKYGLGERVWTQYGNSVIIAIDADKNEYTINVGRSNYKVRADDLIEHGEILKKCPFCGSDNVSIWDSYMTCNNCEADGPWAENAEIARGLWNTRSVRNKEKKEESPPSKNPVPDIEKSLKIWMNWCRNEQFITKMLDVSYMPDVSFEYRKGYVEGLRIAEAHLGLLMIEKGIDLRSVK